MTDRIEAAPQHSPPPAGATAHRRAVAVLAGVGAFAFILDLITKQLATRLLDPVEPVRLLGGALYLSLTRNSGAAFSLFKDFTFIFPLITLAVVSWIGYLARRLRSGAWALSLGLVLGGAVGNLADRLFRAPAPFSGHVVDFLSLFDPHGQAWPIFNVADMALVGGVALAMGLELTGRRRDGSRAGSTQQARAHQTGSVLS